MPSGLHLGNTFCFTAQRCGGRQHGGRAFSAADAMMSTVGVVLDGAGDAIARTHAAPLPITCIRPAAVEGRRGSA